MHKTKNVLHSSSTIDGLTELVDGPKVECNSGVIVWLPFNSIDRVDGPEKGGGVKENELVD